MTQRLQMMLITATSLPLLVALAEIGLGTGPCCPRTRLRWSAPACLSVIVYPAVAVAIGARHAAREQAAPASRPAPHEPVAPADEV